MCPLNVSTVVIYIITNYHKMWTDFTCPVKTPSPLPVQAKHRSNRLRWKKHKIHRQKVNTRKMTSIKHLFRNSQASMASSTILFYQEVSGFVFSEKHVFFLLKRRGKRSKWSTRRRWATSTTNTKNLTVLAQHRAHKNGPRW